MYNVEFEKHTYVMFDMEKRSPGSVRELNDRHHKYINLNSTVQYNMVQYSKVQYSIVQYSTVQYSTDSTWPTYKVQFDTSNFEQK